MNNSLVFVISKIYWILKINQIFMFEIVLENHTYNSTVFYSVLCRILSIYFFARTPSTIFFLSLSSQSMWWFLIGWTSIQSEKVLLRLAMWFDIHHSVRSPFFSSRVLTPLYAFMLFILIVWSHVPCFLSISCPLVTFNANLAVITALHIWSSWHAHFITSVLSVQHCAPCPIYNICSPILFLRPAQRCGPYSLSYLCFLCTYLITMWYLTTFILLFNETQSIAAIARELQQTRRCSLSLFGYTGLMCA